MAAPAVRAVGAVSKGTGAITPVIPTHDTNDILLVVAECAEGSVYSVPDGWAHITDSPLLATGTGNHELTVLWKRAASAAETDPALGDSGDHNIGAVISISGCITTGNPWDVIGSGTETTADTSVEIASIDTTVAETLVLAIAGHGADTPSAAYSNWANANLTDLAEQVNESTNAGHGGGIGVAAGVKDTAGTTGDTTATLGLSRVDSFFHIALKPPAAAGVTVKTLAALGVG